jgi:hypothetical protein
MESELGDEHRNLPSTTQFIDRLISQLASCRAESQDPNDGIDHPTTRPQRHTSTNQSSFSSLPESQLSQVKSVMLTLHCFFPNELLLALDILDRGLVRRFKRDDHAGQATAGSPEETDRSNTERSQEDMFYVISTSAAVPTSPSRAPRTRIEQKGYEVRLHAWNCTCPTFTLNAFRDPGPDHPSQFDEDEDEDETPTEQSTAGDDLTCRYVFGGSLTRGASRLAPPVCKHLLACLLMVRCPGIFSSGSRDQAGPVFLTYEELAAWCAGWGG